MIDNIVTGDADLVAARNALRDSELSFRTFADALPHMVWSTLPDGFHDYYNARWYEFTGVPDGSTDGEAWNGMFHDDDQERAWAIWGRSLETGEPYQIEYRLRHHSGEYRWTLGRAMAVRNSNNEIVRWIGTCTDIHETKRVAETNEILSRELSHRIKNIFAVIGGLVSLSSRQQPGHEAFAASLQQRIGALGRAHEFVRPHSEESRSPDLPESLHGIIRQILAPYPALTDGRIRVEGDDLRVDDRGATPIALVFHELATNAAKYGALSTHDGMIVIRTRIDGERLAIEWDEQNGPAIAAEPDHAGFGSKLMHLSVVGQLGGTFERIWRPEGLLARIEVARAAMAR
ncbi:MAG: PAS domain-containing protein [Tardiphaga sp.]